MSRRVKDPVMWMLIETVLAVVGFIAIPCVLVWMYLR